MRVTNRMLSRNYLRTLNNGAAKIVESERRLTTKMKYENLSDNVADTSRALRADQQITKIEQQKKGIDTANGELDAADAVLQDLVSIFTEAKGQIQNAMNMVTDDSGDSIKIHAIANQIKGMKDEILNFTNSKFANKFMFGSRNNTGAPFSVDADGILKYNGIPVNDIQKENGEFFHVDANGVRQKVPQDKEIYLDVGQGIRVEEGKIDEASGFKISFSGLEILGAGAEKSTGGKILPNNVYALLDTLEKTLREEPLDSAYLGEQFDHMVERLDGIIDSQTDLGSRVSFLERTSERLADQIDTLDELKLRLVGIDEGEESMNLSDHQAAWKATLSLGANLFQTSLIDFLR